MYSKLKLKRSDITQDGFVEITVTSSRMAEKAFRRRGIRMRSQREYAGVTSTLPPAFEMALHCTGKATTH